MTAEDQVKEIIKLLAPKDPNQTDALFLVKEVLTSLQNEVQRKSKQISLLDEKVESLRKLLNSRPQPEIHEEEQS